MDKGLILCVLLVTLSWRFLGTYAQNTTEAPNMSNMPTTPASNMTTMGGNVGATNPAKMSTTAASNMTTMGGNVGETNPANMSTTAASNITTMGGNVGETNPSKMSTTPAGNMTTMGGNVGATNPANMSTTPASNMTTMGGNVGETNPAKMSTTAASNITTMGGNVGETNPSKMSTTPASNMTTMGGNVGATNPANMSTAASTRTPTVSPNNTVVTLEKDISNTGCGSKQLCAAEPSECNPNSTGSCFFLATKQQSGRNFFFELSGESDGYIAATLAGGSGKGNPTYICAKSKGAVKFFSALLQDNNKLTLSVLNVNSVKGKIEGKKIECTFLATVPEPTRAKRGTTTSLSVSTGEFNETDDSLGTPTPVIRAAVGDLGNPNATITNEIASNTTTNPTTAGPTNNPTTVASQGIVIPSFNGSLSQDGCGSSKLCAAEPSECNPATGDRCFYLSASHKSYQTYNFELSGQTDGYIAAGLSTTALQAGSHNAYVCANNNGSVTFFTGILNNLELNVTEALDSSNQRGTVSNGKIQCTFTAVLPDTRSTRAASYALSVSTGTYDPSSRQLGKANFRILTNRANLSDPTANLTNTFNSASSSMVSPIQSSLPVLLVTVSMLVFTAM